MSRAPKLSKYPERVDWVDAFDLKTGWHRLRRLPKNTLPVSSNFGYVVTLRDRLIVLGGVSHDPDPDVGNGIVIPKSWVIRRTPWRAGAIKFSE